MDASVLHLNATLVSQNTDASVLHSLVLQNQHGCRSLSLLKTKKDASVLVLNCNGTKFIMGRIESLEGRHKIESISRKTILATHCCVKLLIIAEWKCDVSHLREKARD